MKKRKHRVVVEITLDEPHTAKQASERVRGMLRGTYKLPGDKESGITKVDVKEGERVVRQEVLLDRKLINEMMAKTYGKGWRKQLGGGL